MTPAAQPVPVPPAASPAEQPAEAVDPALEQRMDVLFRACAPQGPAQQLRALVQAYRREVRA
jgi:hypothetical protein